MKLAIPRLSLFQWAVFAILAFMLAPVAVAAISSSHVATGGKVLAITSITMLDLAKMNSVPAARGIIEENVGYIPELARFPALQLGAGELRYETLIRSGYPTAGFHDMGAGHTASKSSWRKEMFECYPFGGRIEAVKHVADNVKRGGAAALFAAEANGIGKSAMFAIAQQIWYGRGGASAKGFPGIKNFTAYGTTFTDPLTGKSYPLYINGSTGATANTASSVYAVKYSTNEDIPDGVQLNFGTGSVFDLQEPWEETSTDANGNPVRIYASDLQGFAGLVIPNQHCVRRIGNLSSDSGKGLTDALLASMWQSWPQGVRPDAIYMSARSQYQLQLTRSVVLNGNGTVRPDQPVLAPLPTEYNGVPIIVTDAIADTDAVEAAALTDE